MLVTEESNVMNLISHGVNDLLVKPLDDDILIDKIGDHLLAKVVPITRASRK